MIITRPLKDVFQTAAEMRRLTCLYWSDLGRWLDAPFIDYFNFVCALPYRSDPEQIETVSRPAFTLREDYAPRDCDDKAVLIASWLKGHGIPVRFVAISTSPDKELCHVFDNAKINFNGRETCDIDATYNEYHGILGNYPYFPDVTARRYLTEFF